MARHFHVNSLAKNTHTQRVFFLTSILKTETFINCNTCNTILVKDPIFSYTISISQEIKPTQPVVSMRNKKRKNGYKRLTRLMVQSIYTVASNLKILPQPLDLLIAEFGIGKGNGGNWGSGGGGGDLGWGWFDGWRRRGKRKLGLVLGLGLMVFGLGLYFGREIEDHVLIWVLGLGLGLIFVGLIEGLSKRVIRDRIFGILGVSCFGVLMLNWFQVYGDFSSLMKIVMRSRRKRRRAK